MESSKEFENAAFNALSEDVKLSTIQHTRSYVISPPTTIPTVSTTSGRSRSAGKEDSLLVTES
jgi:hypothetical protein